MSTPHPSIVRMRTTNDHSRQGAFTAQHSKSHANRSLNVTSTDAVAGAEEEEEEEDSQPNGEKAAALGTAEASVPSAMPETGNTLTDAVEKRMSELEASGWRPEEEEDRLGENDDDDDDYNGVDLLSESDDHDSMMRRQEEKDMLDVDQMSLGDDASIFRRISISSHDSDFTPLLQLEQLEPDEYYPLMEAMNFEHFAVNNQDIYGAMATSDGQAINTQRRVRFEDELDGSDVASTDSEQVHETFPDLFMAADELGPANQFVDDDEMYLDDGSDAGSCWDFEGEEMNIDFEEDESTDTSGSLSGYETDEGETTDEEAPPPPSSIARPAVSRSSTATDRPSTAGSSSSTKATPTAQSKNAKGMQKTKSKRATPRVPVAGTFLMDPRRPVLLVDGAGSTQRNTYFPARIQSDADKRFWQRLQQMYSNRNTSPRMSVQLTPDEDGNFGDLSAQGTDLNTGGIFDSFGALRADQVIGPAEAFMAFTNFDSAGNATEDNSVNSGSEDGHEDIMDFLNFSGDDDEDEAPEESDAVDSPWTTTTSFPYVSSKNGSRRPSASDDLLAHLDRHSGLVGSFRRNQQFAKHVGSLAMHPGMRASTSEMNAMQTGRRAAANTPITPLRKRRIGKNVGMRSSPIMSPPSKTPIKRKGPARGSFGKGR